MLWSLQPVRQPNEGPESDFTSSTITRPISQVVDDAAAGAKGTAENVKYYYTKTTNNAQARVSQVSLVISCK